MASTFAANDTSLDQSPDIKKFMRFSLTDLQQIRGKAKVLQFYTTEFPIGLNCLD